MEQVSTYHTSWDRLMGQSCATHTGRFQIHCQSST